MKVPAPGDHLGGDSTGRGVQTVINSIVRQRLRLSGHCGMPLIILGDDASVVALGMGDQPNGREAFAGTLACPPPLPYVPMSSVSRLT
jgi:hypothetical protein